MPERHVEENLTPRPIYEFIDPVSSAIRNEYAPTRTILSVTDSDGGQFALPASFRPNGRLDREILLTIIANESLGKAEGSISHAEMRRPLMTPALLEIATNHLIQNHPFRLTSSDVFWLPENLRKQNGYIGLHGQPITNRNQKNDLLSLGVGEIVNRFVIEIDVENQLLQVPTFISALEEAAQETKAGSAPEQAALGLLEEFGPELAAIFLAEQGQSADATWRAYDKMRSKYAYVPRSASFRDQIEDPLSIVQKLISRNSFEFNANDERVFHIYRTLRLLMTRYPFALWKGDRLNLQKNMIITDENGDDRVASPQENHYHSQQLRLKEMLKPTDVLASGKIRIVLPSVKERFQQALSRKIAEGGSDAANLARKRKFQEYAHNVAVPLSELAIPEVVTIYMQGQIVNHYPQIRW